MTSALAGLAGGLGIGLLYFGALWATVRAIPAARAPGLLVFASYTGRLAAAGLGFYGVMQFGGAPALIAALFGFVLVRYALLRHVAEIATGGGTDP